MRSPDEAVHSARAVELDGVRFVLIILVVFGHLLEQVMSGPADLIYRFIYLFHMPAFIFLSGMVSRTTLDVAYARRLLLGIVGVYLLHQFLLQGMDALLFKHPFTFRPNIPYWALWYLMSLLWWRTMLPFLLATGRPVLVACAIALLAGFMPFIGYEWSLSRTLVFLPFFVAGQQWGARQGNRLPAISPLVGFAVLVLLASAAWMTRDFSLKWYYGSVGYSEWRVGAFQGLGYRMLYLLLAATGVFGVLAACARFKGRIFRLGKYSIGAFILHLYLVKVAVAFGWFGWLWRLSEPTRLLLLFATSIAIVITCSLLARMAPWLFDLRRWFRNVERT